MAHLPYFTAQYRFGIPSLMNLKVFVCVYIALQSLVVCQAIASYCDNHLWKGQMKKSGIVGYSLTEHGGIWYDFIVMSALIAYIDSKYSLDASLWRGLIIGGSVIAILFTAGGQYNKMGAALSEAHTHDGTTTIAGWIHGGYAAYVLWVLLHYYLLPTKPEVTDGDFVLVSFVLTPFYLIGNMKFNPRWKFMRRAQIETAAGILLMWTATLIRLWLGPSG